MVDITVYERVHYVIIDSEELNEKLATNDCLMADLKMQTPASVGQNAVAWLILFPDCDISNFLALMLGTTVPL